MFDDDLQVESLAGSGGGSHRPSVSSLGATSTRTEVDLKAHILALSIGSQNNKLNMFQLIRNQIFSF